MYDLSVTPLGNTFANSKWAGQYDYLLQTFPSIRCYGVREMQ